MTRANQKVDTENDVWDQIEHYASASSMLFMTLADVVQVNRDVTKRPHPQALRPFLPELESFARHNHFNILHPILR